MLHYFTRISAHTQYYLQTIGSSQIDDINDAKISPEVLVNLEKIERNATPEVFTETRKKALAGQITVRESRLIEQEYRSLDPKKNNRGRPPKNEEGRYEYLGKNKYEDEEFEQDDQEQKSANQKKINEIAPIIVESLRSQNNLVDWTKLCASMKYPAKYWSSHSEVRVNFDKHRFRLDFVAVVRWSFKRPKDIFILEIKSSLHDFESDNKWENYLNFADFFCFAIPEDNYELIKAVEMNSFNFVGILLINLEDKSIKIHRKPIKQTPQHSCLLYENLYERVLGWGRLDVDSHVMQ